MDFADRLLLCADCHQQFVFTAGEQLFFLDKQFKNDPKRCKPCKSRRNGPLAPGSGLAAAGIARTETRTMCSECNIETTVPFKPTQGRPVLCRQCFQMKRSPTPSDSIRPLPTPASIQVATAELVAAASNSAAAGIDRSSMLPENLNPLPVPVQA